MISHWKALNSQWTFLIDATYMYIGGVSIDGKMLKKRFYVFYYLYKRRIINVLYFWISLNFRVAKMFNPTEPTKLLHKTILKWWI